jgi:hypothetical protein
VTIEAAPVLGQFPYEVRSPVTAGLPCSSSLGVESGGDWTVTGTACIVQYIQNNSGSPHSGGTIVFQFCRSKSTGGFAPKSACANKTARWVTLSKQGNTNACGCRQVGAGVGIGSTLGVRVKYFGKGSGVKNATIGPFDVSRIANG